MKSTKAPPGMSPFLSRRALLKNGGALAAGSFLASCGQEPAAVSPAVVSAEPSQGPLEFNFRGGHGNANFFRAAAYVAEGMRSSYPPDTLFKIVLGSSYGENLESLRSGQVEFATLVPPVCARWAMDGIGLFDEPFPTLRIVTVFPSMEWITVAVSPRLGIRSLEELAEKKPRIRLGTGPLDGHDGMTFLAEEILRLYGVTFDDIRSWGGEIVGGHVRELIRRVRSASTMESYVDMFIQEAKLTQGIGEMPEGERWTLLPLSETVVKTLESELYLKPVVLEPGQRTGVSEPYQTVDLSDYVLATRADIPEQAAYLAAKSAVENRQGFESGYMHLPVERSNLTYPMVPAEMWKNTAGVPLHPGSERFYREAGLMP